MLGIIAAAESDVSRAAFVSEAASLLGLPASALHSDLSRQSARAEKRAPASPPPPAATAPKGHGEKTPEHDLLRLLLHFEELGAPLSTSVPHKWIDQSHTSGVLLNRFLAELENGTWPGRDHLEALMESDDEKSVVAALLFDTPVLDDPYKVAREGIERLRLCNLGPRILQIELALAKTPSDFNDDPSSLLRELRDLQRQFRQPAA